MCSVQYTMDPSYNSFISAPLNTPGPVNLPYLQYNSIYYFEFYALVNGALLVKERVVKDTGPEQHSGSSIRLVIKI